MKKEYILGILFFSSLWGISEVVLGEFLYRIEMPHASVLLTIIGLGILTLAAGYMPQKGVATAIAVFAMLYKFLNTPFFACHILGILMLGICYDLIFNTKKLKNKSVCAALTVYASYTIFALVITYVFRYHPWVQAGFAKIISHIAVGGTLAAAGCAVIVPAAEMLGQKLLTKKTPVANPLNYFNRSRLSFVTAGMWLFALGIFVMHFYG